MFVAFEGLDGSGKSLQALRLTNKLLSLGKQVYLTAEPSKGSLGMLIREILSGAVKFDERVVATLFAADRLDHILNPEDGMLKHQKEGNIIITDRYYFSSFAYHGSLKNLEWLIQLNAESMKLFRPDVHIFIDVDPEICMERLSKGGKKREIYEVTETLTRVRECFYKAFDYLSGREQVVIVNGNQPEEAVEHEIGEVLKSIGLLKT